MPKGSSLSKVDHSSRLIWSKRSRASGFTTKPWGLLVIQVRANWFVADFEHPVVGNYTTAGMPVQFSATPVGFTKPSPRFAEDTTEVLHELGFDADVVAALADSGAVVVGDS